MNRNKYLLAAGLAALAVVLATALVLGQQQDGETGTQTKTSVSAVVSPLLQYQARLSDPATGEPVSDGTYTMTFRLYAAPTGGQPLWTEIKDVPLQNGLLSVLLGDATALDQSLFNGRALWLGIKVGADAETAPRQQMLPAPYALSLVPGAEIAANNSTAALTVSNNGTGDALAAQGLVSVEGDLNVSGSLVGGAHSHSMLPIAYGVINADGTVASATSNVSSSWDITNEVYWITVSGHSYDADTYVTLVSGYGNDLFPKVGAVGGKWMVFFPSITGRQFPFQFVIYKP